MRIVAGLLVALLAVGVAFFFLHRDAVIPEEPADPRPPWFEDVTEAVGLDFVHDAGPFGDYLMGRIMGSGVAWLDCDSDDRLDLLFLVNNDAGAAVTNRLYRQTAAGKFEDISRGSGLDFAGPNMGAAVGDVNNDGRPDLAITQVGGVRLFVNQGGGKFEDVSAAAGIVNPLWATSANFVDVDRDGRLDLVVVNYIDYDPSFPCIGAGGQRDYCSPKSFFGTVSKLFRNRGADAAAKSPVPRFDDVTIRTGLVQKPGPGLGVYAADWSGDGWPDLLIANDGKRNHLWINQRDGTFREEGVTRGIALDAMGQTQANMGIAAGDVNNDGKRNHLWINQRDGTFREEGVTRGIALDAMGQTQANMGIAAGDVNNDGLADVFVTHLTEEKNTLWLQGPAGLFQDRTAAWGLAAARWRATGFGTVMADFDNDGWLDLAVVNGRVVRGTLTPNDALGLHLRDYSERNQLFRNQEGAGFSDVSTSNPAFCGAANVARGLAWADFDGDGGLDLVLTTIAGRARLYRNIAQERGGWLSVRAVDPALGRDAYGAVVTVSAGPKKWSRTVQPGDSYLSSSAAAAHFGLGRAPAVDAIEVLWPDGRRERFAPPAINRTLTIERGKGTVSPPVATRG
jgi:hypothetical protein